MKKKFLYIGIALLVVLVATVGLTQHFITTQGIYNFTKMVITVRPGNYSDYQMVYSNSSQPLVVFEFSPNANAYFMTSSAYAAWQSAAGKTGFNGIAYAESLNGTILAFYNASVVSIPLISNVSETPVYTHAPNVTSRGNYYFVIDNTNDSPSHSKTVSVQVVNGDINSTTNSGQVTRSFSKFITDSVIAGIAIIALIVAAIITIVYGLAAKEKPKADSTASQPGMKEAKPAQDNPEVDALYRGIDDKPTPRMKKGRKKKHDTEKS